MEEFMKAQSISTLLKKANALRKKVQNLKEAEEKLALVEAQIQERINPEALEKEQKALQVKLDEIQKVQNQLSQE
jgi:hypothetical protein